MKVEKAAKQPDAAPGLSRTGARRPRRPSRRAAAGEAEGPGLDALAPSAPAHPDRSRAAGASRHHADLPDELSGDAWPPRLPGRRVLRRRRLRRGIGPGGGLIFFVWLKLRCFRNYGERNDEMLESRR